MAAGGDGGSGGSASSSSGATSGGAGATSGGAGAGGTLSGGGTNGSGGIGGGSSGSGGKGGSGGNANGGNANGGNAGSSSAGSSNGGTGGTGSVDPYATARQTCVDRVNQLRATKGLGPIARRASAESCADGQAKTDSETGKAHSAFNACLSQVPGWTGAAQNECPGWGSVADTLAGCIDAMWAEGPGGGHYDNMVSDSDYIACGFYTTPQGKVWMVQDFWSK